MNENRNVAPKQAVTQIVKEIVIQAPPARVWLHLTDSQRIAGWLMPNDFAAKVGHAFTMDCNQEKKIACVVKELVPQQRLVYTWTSKHSRVETTVTITLRAEGSATRVTLVHSGWDALPPSDRSDVMSGFDQGWSKQLELLRQQFVGAGPNA